MNEFFQVAQSIVGMIVINLIAGFLVFAIPMGAIFLWDWLYKRVFKGDKTLQRIYVVLTLLVVELIGYGVLLLF